MSNVRSINANKNDATIMTPTDPLYEALSDISKGEFAPTKLVVVMLDDRDGQYETRFIQAGMNMSQMVALFEIMKQTIIHDQMGM